MDNLELEVDHITYMAEPLTNEIDFNRLWFLLKQLPYNDATFHEILNLSVYYFNKVEHGCTYSAPIEKNIKECLNRLYR